jgi:uncharacterized protein YbjT (DUF2867 family)
MKLIITGCTGMVGEGVLHEAMQDPMVEKIAVVNRRPVHYRHPKVEEIILPDFFNIGEELSGLTDYDGCLFCLGVSSVGMKKEQYEQLTYDLTLNFAKAILPQNHNMVFEYISGAGTDSSETGRIHWARVKGKVENDLIKLGFAKVYCLRPGYLQPIPQMKHTHRYYSYTTWAYAPLKRIWPNWANSLSDLGLAMIELVRNGYQKQIIGIRDINLLAEKHKKKP